MKKVTDRRRSDGSRVVGQARWADRILYELADLTLTFSQVDRAVCEHEEDYGYYKIMYCPHYKVQGATIVCQRAGELINELALCMHQGIKVNGDACLIPSYSHVVHPRRPKGEAKKKAGVHNETTRQIFNTTASQHWAWCLACAFFAVTF